MKLDLLITQKDWPAATKAIEQMPDDQNRQMVLMMTASKIATRPDGEYPAEFIQVVGKSYAAMLDRNQERANSMDFVTLTTLQWKTGDKEGARASANKAAAAAAKQTAGRALPAAPFERFAKAVEEGNLPTRQQFSTWLREAMPKSPAPATKIQPTPAN